MGTPVLGSEYLGGEAFDLFNGPDAGPVPLA
jgi:hypothetical protein